MCCVVYVIHCWYLFPSLLTRKAYIYIYSGVQSFLQSHCLFTQSSALHPAPRCGLLVLRAEGYSCVITTCLFTIAVQSYLKTFMVIVCQLMAFFTIPHLPTASLWEQNSPPGLTRNPPDLWSIKPLSTETIWRPYFHNSIMFVWLAPPLLFHRRLWK